MESIIAFCGINCSNCPAYIATQDNDQKKRKQIANEWSIEEYPLTADDVQCDGCTALGWRLMSFCNDCDVRQCGLAKEVINCAYCAEYPCNKLDKIYERSPEAKHILEEIRRNM